ncbi:hypothetical protein HMPREF9413_2566 [Paenibacillus sp. HGF7]|nr:hypothetical protein HMPREF9413_2566 [Paenibacillus sp. HGF7]
MKRLIIDLSKHSGVQSFRKNYKESYTFLLDVKRLINF